MSPRDFKLLIPVGKVVKKLPKFLRIQRPTSAHGSPIDPSPLTAVPIDNLSPLAAVPIYSPSPLIRVPIDVVEEILLCLPGQDIVRMKQV
jgi:hypothetical protein